MSRFWKIVYFALIIIIIIVSPSNVKLLLVVAGLLDGYHRTINLKSIVNLSDKDHQLFS